MVALGFLALVAVGVVLIALLVPKAEETGKPGGGKDPAAGQQQQLTAAERVSAEFKSAIAAIKRMLSDLIAKADPDKLVELLGAYKSLENAG